VAAKLCGYGYEGRGPKKTGTEVVWSPRPRVGHENGRPAAVCSLSSMFSKRSNTRRRRAYPAICHDIDICGGRKRRMG
jgi:hypothetical protein